MPAAHASHVVDIVPAAKVPAAHCVQTTPAPVPAEYVPTPHEEQLAAKFMPMPVEYVPASHKMHTEAPVPAP